MRRAPFVRPSRLRVKSQTLINCGRVGLDFVALVMCPAQTIDSGLGVANS